MTCCPSYCILASLPGGVSNFVSILSFLALILYRTTNIGRRVHKYLADTWGEKAIPAMASECTFVYFVETKPEFIQTRATIVLLSTLPAYLISRLTSGSNDGPSWRARILRSLPTTLETLAEINLAIFYLRGTYYDLAKRVLGIRNVCDSSPTCLPPVSQPSRFLEHLRILNLGHRPMHSSVS